RGADGEGGGAENEAPSGGWAGQRWAESGGREEVARGVLGTKSHKVAAADVNAAVRSDADLSVLGAPALRYRQYADAVREEYVSVPDDVFRSARARVLAALLDGPIFHTEVGRERWEEQARRNVGEEVSELNS
ncbi:hypothetical protein ABFW14_33850, partial [Mycolicibacterium fortuitum]|uniref:hypothetical protein n=1 Tax=Mycolicibacterium fortuitum TaxID=1766 RepID=UPI0034CD703A